MSDRRTELREAHDICKRRHVFDREMQERAINLLAGHDLWSMAQVARIVGAPKALVHSLMTKSTHEGGRFNPDTIELILEEIALKDRADRNPLLTAKILDSGTSSYMLAKLTGQSVSTVKNRAAEGRRLAA